MERKTQLWYLIGLTAATMAPQYGLQGWLATGGNPADIAPWFLYVDSTAWAIRAIIEAWALVFLFATQPRDEGQQVTLAVFEISLIVLIAATLGPALAAVGSRQTMKEALPVLLFWVWNFAVASYAPLMLGAAGFAFKVESMQTQAAQNPAAEPATMQPMQAIVLQDEAAKLPTAERRKVIAALLTGGATLTDAELAKRFAVDPTTIYRDRKIITTNGTH